MNTVLVHHLPKRVGRVIATCILTSQQGAQLRNLLAKIVHVSLGCGVLLLLPATKLFDNPAGERTGSNRDQAPAVQHDDHGDDPADTGDRVNVSVADRGEGREHPPVGGGQVTNHRARLGGLHRIDRQGKHDDEDRGVAEELHPQFGEPLVLAVGGQVNHGQEANDTPRRQQHDGQVHQVVRDEVESPRRQVQAHAVVGGEEAPQNHLNDVEVPVVRLLNTRAHDGRGERKQVQHGRHEHGRGSAVFPRGQVLLAAVLAERAEEAGSRSATRRVRDGAGDRADGGRLRSGFAHLAGGVGIGFGGGLGGADAERGPGHDGNTLRARVVARAGNAVALAVRAVGFVAGGVLFDYLFIVFVPRGIVRVVVCGVLCLILCRPIHRRHDTLRPLGPGAPPSVPKRSQASPSALAGPRG